MNYLPIYTKETLTEWADKIDSRLGPIPGRDADALARLLRATGARMQQLLTDRNDQDRALADAIRETASTADELAFWKHQAIYHRCLVLEPKSVHRLFLEDHPIWREAERQLEAQREAENRERTAHAEAPRDPGAT
jgi:hypothetical protein